MCCSAGSVESEMRLADFYTRKDLISSSSSSFFGFVLALFCCFDANNWSLLVEEGGRFRLELV